MRVFLSLSSAFITRNNNMSNIEYMQIWVPRVLPSNKFLFSFFFKNLSHVELSQYYCTRNSFQFQYDSRKHFIYLISVEMISEHLMDINKGS